MVLTQIESRFAPEFVDYFILGVIKNLLTPRKIVNFTKHVRAIIPGDILNLPAEGKFFYTLRGSCQQKLVVCYDVDHLSSERIKQLFFANYGETFTEGDDMTKAVYYEVSTSYQPLRVHMFGIVTDKVEDVVMANC